VRGHFSVGLVVVCLGLAGCITSNKKGATDNGPPKPFDGKPASQQDPIPGQLTSGNSDRLNADQMDGVLVGRVMTRYDNRGLAHAYIQVLDLDNPNPRPDSAPPRETDTEGYFYIKPLRRGHHYQLIARAQDDGHYYVGRAFATAPDIKLVITMTEDTNPADGPAVPSGVDSAQPANPAPPARQPAATMNQPIPLPGDTAAPSTSMGNPSPLNQQPGVSPERVADGTGGSGGFLPVTPKPPPVVDVPNPIVPPPPAVRPDRPRLNPTGLQTSNNFDIYSNESATRPWALLYGREVKGLALYSLAGDGTMWNMQQNRQGKVLLLDFWATDCPPCIRAIHELVSLQDQFRAYGLEVIGITYDNHPNQLDQVKAIKALRSRLRINYPTLLGNGKDCQVMREFQITRFPTLILLGEDNTVVWRSDKEGLTEEKLRSLKREIAKQLRVQMPHIP
jgi:thiol-disulfide isomerase/thioredoxin